MMHKILFITQKRSDAIGIVDNAVSLELSKLHHNFDFLKIYKKGDTKPMILYNYIRNIFLIIRKSIRYQTIYFSRENPFVIPVKLFFPWKKISMKVHHVEEYRGKSIIGKRMIRSVSSLIAISEFTKQQLVRIGAKSELITVQYNGISDQFYPEHISHFTPYEYVLYVGTEAPRKNLKLLFQAFQTIVKQYPHIKLVKIGMPGSAADEQATNEILDRLHLADHVVLMRDFFSEEILRKWYSNAICYVSVSKLEGFGLTIPEAMACGCPVVASDIGPFREIVGDSQIIVDPDDVDEISAGIISYIKDLQKRKMMSREGILLSKKFNWELNVTCLIEFFMQKS